MGTRGKGGMVWSEGRGACETLGSMDQQWHKNVIPQAKFLVGPGGGGIGLLWGVKGGGGGGKG